MAEKTHRIFFCLIGAVVFLWPFFVLADSEGQQKIFFVDPLYDAASRTQIQATLQKVSAKGYFYVEKTWYEELAPAKKKEVLESLKIIADEFDRVIYPQLTAFYGSEWSSGIDNDERITILFHQMKESAAGYFNNGDEYEKIQNPNSNEREMIYLNAENIPYEIVKSYLAHEFTHLIVFNQKERLRGVKEEVWLNEGRAEFAPTLLGYDDKEYEDTNLRQRIKIFAESPADSVFEWQGQKKDYGVLNIFIQYLVDYYGKEILSVSLKSSKTGLLSLNEFLRAAGVNKAIEDIFADWAVAVLVNDCRFGEFYCYKNKNLSQLKIVPSLLFLPSAQRTSISLNYAVKPWAANWYRIVGGQGSGQSSLKIKFSGRPGSNFKIPFVLCQDSSACQVKFFGLKNEQGEITVNNFGRDWNSLTLIPFAASKLTDLSQNEPLLDFSLTVSFEKENEEEEIARLLAQAEELKAQIALLQAKLAALLGYRAVCGPFRENLSLGQKSFEVTCLQEFLKAQGAGIYPEGIVSGFFGALTRKAVIRFQEKYASEILTPFGYQKGTGFVGPATRKKINQILGVPAG